MFAILATLLFSGLQGDPIALQADQRSQPARREISKADDERRGGHPDTAIPVCRKWLADPKFDPDRFAKKSVEHLASFIVRGEAQKCLAQSLEASGLLDDAIAAYGDCTGKYPIPSFCGNAYAEQKFSSRMGQGRCLERLNRHREAIEIYFSTIDLSGLCDVTTAIVRVVEIYEADGRLDGLKDLLSRRDLRYVDQESMAGRRIPDLETLNRELPSRHFRRILSFANAEKEGHWEELIRAVEGTWRIRDDRFNACIRLARHASATVPLLKTELSKGLQDRGWVAYALGLCGGEEAVAALRNAVPEEPDGLDWYLLLRGLDRSGAPGRAVLRDLRTKGPSFGQAVDDVYEKSSDFPYESATFPPIPKGLKLD
jgi:tetratricopeptide (TPR) repeat protein